MQLTIQKKNALAAHRRADKETKAVLEELFGKDVLNQNILERIETFEDICAEAGVNPARYAITDDMDEEDKYAIYAKKIRLIARVLNEGVKLDYSNPAQPKYYPYFKWQGAGFGFSGSVYNYDAAGSYVGSRFASRELAEFAGRTFIKEYNDLLQAQQ